MKDAQAVRTSYFSNLPAAPPPPTVHGQADEQRHLHLQVLPHLHLQSLKLICQTTITATPMPTSSSGPNGPRAGKSKKCTSGALMPSPPEEGEATAWCLPFARTGMAARQKFSRIIGTEPANQRCVILVYLYGLFLQCHLHSKSATST